MENKQESKPVLKYTNKEYPQTFSEGDAVICFTECKICTGTIVAFSSYKESENSDLQDSVYLDTSKDSKNRSCEIIKVADIKYMSKITASDMFDYPKTNEKLDRHNFINMIVALGHAKENAEIMYDSMKEFIALYNIPLSSMLANATREFDICAGEGNVDEFRDISRKLLEVMAKVFQSLTDVIMQKAKAGIERI